MSKIIGFTMLFLFAGTMAFAQSPQCNKSSAQCSEAAIKACAEKHNMTVEQCKALCKTSCKSSASSASAGMESTPIGKLAAYPGATEGKANCAAAKTQCGSKASTASKTCQPANCKGKSEAKSTTTAMREQLYY